MLELGVILTAYEGLGMYQKAGTVGSDSFEEGQRKDIKNYIPVNFVLIVWGKKQQPWNEPSNMTFKYHQARVNMHFVMNKLWQMYLISLHNN